MTLWPFSRRSNDKTDSLARRSGVLLGEVIQLNSNQAVIGSFPLDDRRYRDYSEPERRAAAKLFEDLHEQHVWWTLSRNQRAVEGDILQFECLRDGKEWIACDVVNLTAKLQGRGRQPQKERRRSSHHDLHRSQHSRSSSVSSPSGHRRRHSTTPESETASERQSPAPRLIMLAIKNSHILRFTGEVQKLPSGPRLGIIRLCSILAPEDEQSLAVELRSLIEEEVPFRAYAEGNAYMPYKGEQVTFRISAFQASFGPGKTYRATDIQQLPQSTAAKGASARRTSRYSGKTAQTRPCGERRRSSILSLPQSPFGYCLGIIVRIPSRSRPGLIEVRPAEHFAKMIAENNPLCVSVNADGSIQHTLSNLALNGVMYEVENCRSLAGTITPKTRPGDIVAFELDRRNTVVRASAVINIMAAAYLSRAR